MPAIASKCYKAGEVIVECKPIVHCVKEGSKGKYCDHCLKESVSLKKCSKCLKMYYCGKECQSTDWKYHKYECKVFKNPKFKMESSLAIERLVLRLWLFAENNPTFVSKRYKLFDGSDVSLNGIEFDAEKLKRNKLLMMAFAYICDRLKTIGLEFETEKLFYWYGLCNWGSGVFTINKIAKYASDLEILSDSAKIVSAIYIELVKVGHSCLPNGDYVTDGLLTDRPIFNISTNISSILKVRLFSYEPCVTSNRDKPYHIHSAIYSKPETNARNGSKISSHTSVDAINADKIWTKISITMNFMTP